MIPSPRRSPIQPLPGQDYMIPYMVGKLVPNPTHHTRGPVKYVPGRGYFGAVPSQNGNKSVTSPPLSIVELVYFVGVRKVPLYLLRVDRQWEVGREKECQSRERERDGKRVGR